jgi:hypothetical protein
MAEDWVAHCAAGSSAIFLCLRKLRNQERQAAAAVVVRREVKEEPQAGDTNGVQQLPQSPGALDFTTISYGVFE